MRIALIDPSLFTWPYDRELALALTRAGHDAVIVGKTLDPGDPHFSDPLLNQHFYPRLPALSSRIRTSTLRIIKGFSHVTSMARLIPALRAWKPDVVHFHWLPLPIVDRRFLPFIQRIAPTVMTVHDTLPFNGAPGSSLQTLGALSALKRFHRLIVHTGQGVKRVSLHVGGAENIACIAHGLLHQDASALPPTRAKVGPDGKVTFLLFGKLKPYKGVDVLIQALSFLSPATRAKCRIRIVGRPYMPTEPLMQMAQDLGVADMIDWQLRFVSDEELTRQIDDAGVLLFPYREIEASGVLMAGIARGRPVIASRLGAFAELLEDGKQGLLVAAGDPSPLANAIERTVSEDGMVDTLAAGMEGLRSSIPTWADIACQTVSVYDAARHDWRRSTHQAAVAPRDDKASAITS
jgi:glycosyltransferase involved in cell wall biosynthesis